MKPLDLRAEFLMPVTVEVRTNAPTFEGPGGRKWPAVVTGEPYYEPPIPEGAPKLLRKELTLELDADLYALFIDQKAGQGDRFKLLPMDSGKGIRWFAIKEYESVAKLDERVTRIKKDLEEKYAKRLDEMEALLGVRGEEIVALQEEVKQIRKALVGREQTKNEAKDVAELRNKIRNGFKNTGLEGKLHARVIERLLGRRVGLDGIDDTKELTLIYNTALRVHYRKTTWDEVLDGTKRSTTAS